MADYPPGARLPERTIADFELVWMLRGHARIATSDDHIALAPGRLLLVPPDVPHGFAWDPARPSRHGYVHFGPDTIGTDLPPHPRVRPMTSEDPFAGLCAYMLWLGQTEPDGWEQQLVETLGFLLAAFVSGPLPTAETSPALPSPLTLALDHLRQVWSRPPLRRVEVGELASVALVSRGYFGRLFRASFGLSPAPALERVRCSRAETLLIRTDLSVATIAHQCGFADLSHLSHRFTALNGVAPRAYRAAITPEGSVLDDPGVRRLARLLW